MRKYKIVHIVGNRPQFIKLAPLSKELHKRGYEDIIIHTGQHYDSNMSDIFFEELEIQKPNVNLGVGSGSHAEITAKAMIGIECELLKMKPDIVIVYGDTDTTLAATVACKKLNIPIAHVEAGGRTFSKTNPEEANRIMVDHIADLLFATDLKSVENLKREGIIEGVYFTGDIMYDTFLQTSEKMPENLLEKYGIEKDNYVLMTCHRQENTDDLRRMEQIIEFLEKIPCKIIYPIHPRTKKMLCNYGLWNRINANKNLKIIEPIGYSEMVCLQKNCKVILTDSGGVSKESVFAGARCLFILDLKIWPNLEEIGWLKHIDFDNAENVEEALQIIAETKAEGYKVDFFGDGHAAEKMVDIILSKLKDIVNEE